VRGVLVEEGWGATLGFPALTFDPAGPPVAVWVFESSALPEHWERLDAFEGDGYRRVVVDVATASGVIAASIYVAAEPVPAAP
jgi:gamma-glutamylcyclotransferase (GGCT)/AIG2-like uncharacterized protein YtfP